jgi:hypothetical protein
VIFKSADYTYTRAKNAVLCIVLLVYQALLAHYIVRMDERTENVFFLAGEKNIIEIYPNGKWRYIVG